MLYDITIHRMVLQEERVISVLENKISIESRNRN